MLKHSSLQNKHIQWERRKSIAFRSLISSQSDFLFPLSFLLFSPKEVQSCRLNSGCSSRPHTHVHTHRTRCAPSHSPSHLPQPCLFSSPCLSLPHHWTVHSQLTLAHAWFSFSILSKASNRTYTFNFSTHTHMTSPHAEVSTTSIHGVN